LEFAVNEAVGLSKGISTEVINPKAGLQALIAKEGS
jgi:hypothetical protein